MSGCPKSSTNIENDSVYGDEHWSRLFGGRFVSPHCDADIKESLCVECCSQGNVVTRAWVPARRLTNFPKGERFYISWNKECSVIVHP
jgi:hypothetical protein